LRPKKSIASEDGDHDRMAAVRVPELDHRKNRDASGAAPRCFLHDTDHLSDRELYEA